MIYRSKRGEEEKNAPMPAVEINPARNAEHASRAYVTTTYDRFAHILG